MMRGKDKCVMLKEIRKQIATENDIPYVVSECKHQGECKGTCPKCESELRYLEKELAKKHAAGKAVALAGISAGLMMGLTGCTTPEANNYNLPSVGIEQNDKGDGINPGGGEKPDIEIVELEGDVPAPINPPEPGPISGPDDYEGKLKVDVDGEIDVELYPLEGETMDPDAAPQETPDDVPELEGYVEYYDGEQ